jgi:acetate kinase
METILVVNAGSSSLKFQVFTLGALPDLKCARHTLSVLSRDAARAVVSENVARRRFAS